jgi:hypothetical protein
VTAVLAITSFTVSLGFYSFTSLFSPSRSLIQGSSLTLVSPNKNISNLAELAEDKIEETLVLEEAIVTSEYSEPRSNNQNPALDNDSANVAKYQKTKAPTRKNLSIKKPIRSTEAIETNQQSHLLVTSAPTTILNSRNQTRKRDQQCYNPSHKDYLNLKRFQLYRSMRDCLKDGSKKAK